MVFFVLRPRDFGIRPSLLLLLLLFLAATASADDLSTTATLTRANALLRIGYLRPEGESQLTGAQMDALREVLGKDAGVAAAMQSEGFAGIGLFEADGGRDMLNRLNSGEFDVAFVPSRLWAEQQSRYTIILQSRRERDFTSTRDRRVLQRGVIFISPRSEFFDDKTIAPAAFAEWLGRSRMAVVASQSIAGYVAPMLTLQSEAGAGTQAQPELLWCETSAEVAKAVLSGLADAGACEEGALDETLESAGILSRRKELLRIVHRTNPVPTDPVVVHPTLAPQSSVLGRELKRAIRSFSLQNGFAGVSLQNAQDQDYLEVRDLLKRYEEAFMPVGAR